MLEELVRGMQVAEVICYQWGDSGKGKITDALVAEWADVNARGTGGNNAGHTVVVNGETYIFHFLPSGILHDGDGKITVLGNGMVINPEKLFEELDVLEAGGRSYDNLMVSQDAHVILPYHCMRDRAVNLELANGGIGSTGKGIGPAYADKSSRWGVKVGELFDRDVLVGRIREALPFYFDQDVTLESVLDSLEPHIERLRPLVRDTIPEMHDFLRGGKKILLEGAQGLLLSLEFGTYPYVTSSDCSANGTATGVGLPARVVDLPLGIVKFPFMTRVGGGPFPTEIGREESELYCAEGNGNANVLEIELERWGINYTREDGRVVYDKNHTLIVELMNSSNPLEKSIGIRLAANEFGATTGRPRRDGWTDAVAGRYAVNVNGPLMILTKPDALAGIDEFKLCWNYEIDGKKIRTFPRDEKTLRRVQPVYKTYEGYGNVEEMLEDGSSFWEAVGDFEMITRGHVVAVSVGAERDATIVRGLPDSYRR